MGIVGAVVIAGGHSTRKGYAASVRLLRRQRLRKGRPLRRVTMAFVGADLCVRPPTADAATKNAPVSYVVRDKGVNSSAVPLFLPPEFRRPLKVCPVTGAAGGAY